MLIVDYVDKPAEKHKARRQLVPCGTHTPFEI